MVANGYGITLVPEIAARAEVTGGRIELVRFNNPERFRALGLAWRRTLPRERDFVEIVVFRRTPAPQSDPQLPVSAASSSGVR